MPRGTLGRMSDGESPRGQLIVVSGPAAVGKDSLLDRARAVLPALVKSVSMTTRPRATGEVNGVNYFFVSRDEFLRHRDADELLEWASVFDDYYGTPAAWVRAQRAAGCSVAMNIDVKGGLQVKRLAPDARLVFIMPPEPRLEVLSRRLHNRHRDSDTSAAIVKRLETAVWEMEQAPQYDRVIVNDDLDRAAAELIAVIQEP